MADYRYAVGTFARALTTGNQVVTGISDAAGAFTPKAVIFWTTFQSAEGFAADARTCIGFSDTVKHRLIASFAQNNVGGTKANRSYLSDLYCIGANTSAPTTITDTATLDALASGQFTLNWHSNNGVAWNVHYLALGGADLSAQVLTIIAPAAPGSQATTGLGIGPLTGLLTLGVWATKDVSLGVATIATCNQPVMGWTDGVHQGANAVEMGDFPAVTNAYRQQRTDRVVVLQDSHGVVSAGDSQVAITSLDADGFTLNWVSTSYPGPEHVSANYAGIFCLAISGPTLAVGTVTQGAASLTLPFKPGAVLFSTIGAVANTAVQTDGLWSFAAASPTALAAIWQGNLNGLSTSAAGRNDRTDQLVASATPNVAPGSSVLNATAVPTLTATGLAFTWPVNDSVSRELLYCAFTSGPIIPPAQGVEGCVVSFPTGGV